MATSEKQLLIRLVARADGQPVIAGFGRTVNELASFENRLQREMRETNVEARRQSGLFSDLSGSTRRWLGVIAGTAGLGVAAKHVYDYSESLEGTEIAIAGLLFANTKYTDSLGKVVDSNTAFQAASAEATALMQVLQRESLKTAATVPQIADAFAIVFGALRQAGVQADNNAIVQLTTRLTQAANAMKIPMDQIRQEIKSLLTGQISSDSELAQRLGLDNASVKRMQANGTLISELLGRTAAYAKAAEAQANTFGGKLVNTVEIVTSTLARAFQPLKEQGKGVLDDIFGFFVANGDKIVSFVHRVIEGIDLVVERISGWITKHKSLVEEILSLGAVAATAALAYGVITGAIAAITSPIGLAIVAVIGLATLWENTRQYAEIQVGGRPIAAYIRATFEFITGIYATHLKTQYGIAKAIYEGIAATIATISAAGRLTGTLLAIPIRLFQTLREKVSESAEKIGGVFVGLASKAAGPVARILGFVVGLGASFRTLIGAAEGPANKVAEIFSGLVSKLTAPLRKLLDLLAKVPDQLVAMIPGAAAVRDAARNFAATLPGLLKPAETLAETIASIRRDGQKTATNVAGALNTKEGFGSIADAVKGAWSSAAQWLDSQLPQLAALGKTAANALGLTGTPLAVPKPGSGSDAKKNGDAAAKLKAEKDEYLRWINDYRGEATAAGDPLGQALAKIRADREDALSKLEAQRTKLKDAISAKVFDSDKADIEKVFARRTSEAQRKSVEGIKNDLIASLRLQHQLTVGAQREIEDQRIALITNSIHRELAERLTANRRWLEDETARVTESVANETERANQIAALAEERKRRDERDQREADRQMRESTFGYGEYWKKLADTIKAQWRSIGQIIADTVLESRRLLADSINGFLNDLTSGQSDLLKSLSGLSKGLSSLWTKALTEVLMSGKSVAAQLKDLFKSIQVKKEDGTTDYLGTALSGAGFGGMVGGLFQTETNYAGIGGTIGGALGAVIGTAIGGQTALGAVIGTAIGTAVGSMIQKGKDSINVAIKDGVATVTEKGISAKAREEVQTQVQRKVNEEVKGWQSILDLFPKSVRDKIAKLPKPTLNLAGGVESADLTDQGALNSLSDFLTNDLPKAAFREYSAAVSAGLQALGAGSGRLGELFTYWGTLQGKELHDAVERYVRVVLDTADVRGKLNSSLDEKIEASKKYGTVRPLDQLDDISAAIDAAVERMAGLKDIEDIIAAQQEVNQLSRQYYETQLQYLTRIQQVQDALIASVAQQREQLQLGGKTDQEKVDYFFGRMLALRGQLAAATDPEEISRLTQQIQQYVSQASGVAPDNAEMRAKLLGILDDVEKIANSSFAAARQELAKRDDKPASALERAAELLLKAASDLAKATDPNKPPPDRKPPDERPRPGDVDRPRPRRDRQLHANAEPEMTQLVDNLDRLIALREQEFALGQDRMTEVREALRQKDAARDTSAPRKEDFAAALREALQGIEFTIDEPIYIDNGDLGEAVAVNAERRVIARLKNDKYALTPRT